MNRKPSNAEVAEVNAEERREETFAPSARTSASSALVPPASSLHQERVGRPTRDWRPSQFMGPKHSVCTGRSISMSPPGLSAPR